MGTINSSDTLFATLTQRGNIILSLKLSGIKSDTELMHHIYRSINGCMGLATLTLRNGTQGWSSRKQLLLKSLPKSHATKQLCLWPSD